jgi:hypothetical protein
VWEEATRKQRNLKKYQRVQRLINIKIAKAYRTISYEASCVMAGAKPIGIKIGEITQCIEQPTTPVKTTKNMTHRWRYEIGLIPQTDLSLKNQRKARLTCRNIH